MLPRDPAKYVAPVCLAIALVGLSFYYYANLETWFPSHIHAWTQSDRLALSYGFLDNGMNFFLPRTYNVFTVDGVTGVDFPVHDYIVALIMKFSGSRDPLIFRLYTLAYSFIGYFFLYRLAYLITRSTVRSAIAVLFVFTCPVITYYQFGFIPSATSLSSSFIGLYFYFRFLRNKNYRHFYLGLFFLVLAALPRLSVNIVLFAVLIQEAFYALRARRLDKRKAIAFSLAYGAIFISLAYKTYLNTNYGSRFLTALMPASDGSQLVEIIGEVIVRWTFQLFTPAHWILLAAVAISLLLSLLRKRLSSLEVNAVQLGTLICGGSLIFFLLLARQFVAHEYYFMDSLYTGIFLLFIAGLRSPVLELETRMTNMLVGLVTIALLISAATSSFEVQEEKYVLTQWDRGEVTRKNFTGSATFLDDLGIPRDAIILVYEAYSTNAPLVLMDRKGYTVLDSRDENIRRALDLPFDYVVVQDRYLTSEVIFNYPKLVNCLDRIGGNGRISVFTVRDKTCIDDPVNYRNIAPHVLGVKDTIAYFRALPGQLSDAAQRITNNTQPVSAAVEFGPGTSFTAEELSAATHTLVTVHLNPKNDKERRIRPGWNS